MADETNPDKPLAALAEAETRIEPAVDKAPLQGVEVPFEPHRAGAARLRAFEDENFGKDAVRINGRIERGSGSPYQAMNPAKRRQYQALEKLVEADDKLVAAHAALMEADAAHEAALEAVALAEKEADAAAHD